MTQLFDCYEVYRDYIKFKTKQTENAEKTQTRKNSFSKELVENTDLQNAVLNANKA